MISKSLTLERELMLPSGSAEDLGRSDCMRLAIKRAFPLPSTGAFTDLLAALDVAPATFEREASARNLPGKPSTSVKR